MALLISFPAMARVGFFVPSILSVLGCLFGSICAMTPIHLAVTAARSYSRRSFLTAPFSVDQFTRGVWFQYR